MKRVLCLGKRHMSGLLTFLKSEGLAVYQTVSEKEAMVLLEQNEYHILVAENNGKDKFSFIRSVRAKSKIPILVISEQNTERSVIEALNAGADEFVAVPFSVTEAAARIKSQIRRYTEFTNLCKNINQIYRIDELVIDDSRRRVTVAAREVRLTPIEYKILRLLVQQKGKVFSISQIYESIWNMQAIGADNTIAVHIRHIREKIEQNPKEPKYIKVVWGSGYKVG